MGARPTIPSEEPPTPAGAQPSTTGQQVSTTEQAGPEVQTSPPYNLWFAIVALMVSVVAYVLTILLFRDLFDDPAVVAGSLGALFTLIGTVTGAYFGIKASGDTADRAKKQVDEASARVESANEVARLAFGRLDPNTAKELDKI